MFNLSKVEKAILLIFLVSIAIYGFNFKASLDETKALGIKTNLSFTIIPSVVKNDQFCIKLSDYKASLFLESGMNKENVTVSAIKVNECIKEVFINNKSVMFQDNDCINLNEIPLRNVGGKYAVLVYSYCL